MDKDWTRVMDKLYDERKCEWEWIRFMEWEWEWWIKMMDNLYGQGLDKSNGLTFIAKFWQDWWTNLYRHTE